MNSIHDLLLPMPISEPWARALLFFTFFLHFVFVLLTIGTGVLGIFYLIARQYRAKTAATDEPAWNLTPFFVYKSLAIVLGIGPLLLMQVARSVPFITAANLFGMLWMAVIALLLSALALLEVINERKGKHREIDIVVGVLGLACLLAVPAILSLLLVTTENPRSWPTILTGASRLPWSLSWHWLFRVLHVVGAAIAITAGVELLRAHDALRRKNLQRWMLGALAFQFSVGIALFASLPRFPQPMIVAFVAVGIAAAGLLLWRMFRSSERDYRFSTVPLLSLLAIVLVPMLVTRQLLQDQVLLPVQAALEANAQSYRVELAHAPAGPKQGYQVDPDVRRPNSQTLYLRSCTFCHGMVANGKGEDAGNLKIPPENLSAIRSHRPELRRILIEGVPGTAMPQFNYYTSGQIEGILDFLELYAGLKSVPEPVTFPLTEAKQDAAAIKYAGVCAICHGMDGRGSDLGRTLSPRPPDLTVYSLSPQQTFTVITQGYGGTLMPSFAHLSEEMRWGLTEIVLNLYEEDSNAASR